MFPGKEVTQFTATYCGRLQRPKVVEVVSRCILYAVNRGVTQMWPPRMNHRPAAGSLPIDALYVGLYHPYRTPIGDID